MYMYVGDTCISHTQKYIYLGSPFMNAPVSVQIGEHIAQKQRHIRTFSSFLAKNEDAPFKVKWTTWNSAMMSAMYGCESWMTKDMRRTTVAHTRQIGPEIPPKLTRIYAIN